MRTFELLRQMYVHIKHGYSVLLAASFIFHYYGVTYRLDAHFINGKVACVDGVLYVFDSSRECGLIHFDPIL